MRFLWIFCISYVLFTFFFSKSPLPEITQSVQKISFVDSTLKAHRDAWFNLSHSNVDWRIFIDKRFNLSLSTQISIYDIISRLPDDWSVLQLYVSDTRVRQRNKRLGVGWVHWLPHHTGHGIYAIRKNQAMKVLKKTSDNSHWTRKTEEDMFSCGSSYTLTHSKHKIVINDSSLLIITVTTVNDLTHFESIVKQLEQECSMRFYKSAPHWIVTFVFMENWHDKKFVDMACPNIEFNLVVQNKTFNKWLYVIPYISKMRRFDYVLYKDFDQLLTGFDWQTFMKPKSVIRSAIRESIRDSVSTHKGPKRAWFQVNDAAWWRTYEFKKWSTLKYENRPFLEMYFVLFQGAFASWFFSTIFSETKFIDEFSDWGPDLMWCGAAADWSAEIPPCVIVPVTTFHADERQISRYRDDNKERMLPVKVWEEQFPVWINYSSAWRKKWGGNTQWRYTNTLNK